MNERRTFLKVLGGAAVAFGPGCGSSPAGAGSTTGRHTTGSATATSTATTTGAGGMGGGGEGGGGGAGGTGTGSGGGCGAGGASMKGTNNDACQSLAGTFDLGPVSAYAARGLHRTPDQNGSILLGRDAGGLYAISALCTHACCDMNTFQAGQEVGTITAAEVICNCHGSVFNLDGSVQQGPARLALQAYEIALDCKGHLFADTTKPVASTVRLKA